jgi:hypothetical protein
MKRHSRRGAAAVVLTAALLFRALPSAAAQEETVEWVETGRFGAGEGGPPQIAPMKPAYTNKRLHLGARLGPSMRIYTPSGDTPFTGRDTMAFSMDAAVQANLQVLSFLSIQGEAVFTLDNASDWIYSRNPNGQIDRYARDFGSFSLQIPLLVHLNFYPGKFRLSPFFGAYYLAALGRLKTSDSQNNQESSWSYGYNPPFGLAGGLNGAMRLGSGMIFLDLRYTADLGEPTVKMGELKTYRRSMVSFSLGYEFGFFTKRGGRR